MNPLLDLSQRDEPIYNGWCTIPSSWSAEVMARAGWHSVTLDLQHGLIDYSHVVPMFQAIQLTGTAPLARAPWNEPGIVMKLLDAGALGVICPMVNTAEECARFVGACRYPPIGYRSYGPLRARAAFGTDYEHSAQLSTLAFAMIETAEALRHLDAILDVPGLSGVYVGPADLSLSLGSAERSDPTNPHVLDAIARVAMACRARGLIAGIHCGSSAFAHQMIALGYRFITVSTDSALLSQAARDVLEQLRGGRSSSQGGVY
ncbi:MAG: HpcH/HpaI aldolase family protein [Thermoflexales bacterium]